MLQKHAAVRNKVNSYMWAKNCVKICGVQGTHFWREIRVNLWCNETTRSYNKINEFLNSERHL